MYNAEKTLSEYRELVENMRKAQKEYFKTRDYQILVKSKHLESEVDRFFNHREKPNKSSPLEGQGDLFL